MDQNPMGQKCACPHHKIMPILIILLGLTFLLNNLGVISTATGIIWPIILILIGLQKMLGKNCKCCGTNQKPAA